jgi:hypothetical protein
MTLRPIDPAVPGDPDDVPWTALEDLAAGALTPQDAARLRARIAAEPALAAAFARVEALDAALALEGLHEFPADLGIRILDEALGVTRLGAGAVAWRVAAAVVLAVSAWVAVLGRAPAVPRADALPAWAHAPVALPADRALAAAPELPAPAAPFAALAAVALVAGGIVLARRWGTGPSPAREGGAA